MCRLVLLLLALHPCAPACYFPIELQGEYVVQSTSVTPGGQVQYSQVNITAEAIPIWGHCYRRLKNSVILTDSSGGANCSRCFHIMLRSRNVLQVRTEGLDKCYTNQDAAEATCPDEKTVNSKDIILYKTKDLGGEEIRQVYCPINGRFNFIYNVNDGSESRTECPDPISELDNCPSGSGLNLRFRRCSFEDRDLTYQCLGHWSGPGDQQYLALRDSRPGKHNPPYRCALYREETGTGNIFLAFSSDSTCNSNLRSATNGFETLSLSIMPASGWPSQVDNSNCRFPQWSHGYWQHMYIESNVMTYKDHSTFKTYTIRCLGPDSGIAERIPVFARTQCGEEIYTCIWLKRRGMNVLEFQLGVQYSTYYNSTLCSEAYFEPNVWITQGRLERLQESPCPVAGGYTGVIPDATNLCAKLSSDCQSPEIMYYTVSDCTHSEIYEGTWRRGRKRRQTGTRIYRISNPRSSPSPLPSTFTSFPSNQSNHDTTSSWANNNNGQNGQPYSHSGTYDQTSSHGGISDEQHRMGNAEHSSAIPEGWSYSDSSRYNGTASYGGFSNDQYRPGPRYNSEPAHGRVNYSYYNSRGPWYPTSYHLGSNVTTLKPYTIQDNYSEEEYDPWTFSKTHGNQTYTKNVESKYRPRSFDENRGYSRNSESHHRINTGSSGYNPRNWVSSESPRTQDQIARPYNQWNADVSGSSRYNPSEDTSRWDPRSSTKIPNREDGRRFRNNDEYGMQSTPGGYRHHTEYPQETPRTGGGYYGSSTTRGFSYTENSHVTQKAIERIHVSNFPVTQRTAINYPGSRRDWSSYEKNSHTDQRTFSSYPQSSQDRQIVSSENSQGTRQNDGYSRSHKDQRYFSSHDPAPQFSGSGTRGHEVLTNDHIDNGHKPEIYGNTESTIKHIYATRSYDHGAVSANPRPDLNPSIGTRDQNPYRRINVNGQNQGIPRDAPTTNQRNGRVTPQQQWHANANDRHFYEASSPTIKLDQHRSTQNRSPIPNPVPVPHPVQLPSMSVHRNRYGDRPSAIPRTAASSIREEREYRCLGQWEEDGLMYTYTQRRDVGTYECFVGSIISNDEIYIKEAGDHCQRNIDPMHYGMKLTREGSCSGNQQNRGSNTGGLPQPRPTTMWSSSRHPPEPTKPWKPITAPPRSSAWSAHHSSSFTMITCIIIGFIVHLYRL